MSNVQDTARRMGWTRHETPDGLVWWEAPGGRLTPVMRTADSWLRADGGGRYQPADSEDDALARSLGWRRYRVAP